ncbi:hypothetical protein JCM11641_004105 [Rhodosporidiobolus odoratus]
MSNPASAPPLRIAVVGGGIAGLTMALALLKHKQQGANIQLDLYEQAPQFAEIGAGVAFGPNAQRALRMMGVGDTLDAVAGPAGDDANLWFDFKVGDEGENSGKHFATVTGHNAARGSVHRADFLDELIKRLPSEHAHFNHHAVSYTPHSSGVTIHFDKENKEEKVEADVLIDSSGIKSALRRHLYERKGEEVEKQKARYSEWIAWRGLIPREKYEEVFRKGANDKVMHCGKGRHILTFPVREGKPVNIVGFVRDEDHKKLGDHDGPWSESRPKEELLEDFSQFNEDCKELLGEIEDPSIWGIFALPPIEHVTDDRVVLIGDSAHATTPHQGAGAGQAVEDSLFLSTLLCHPILLTSPPHSRPRILSHALSIYATERHPRAQKVQTTSDEAGRLYEFLGEKEGGDLEKIRENLEGRMGWIWEEDLEKEVERVGRMMEEFSKE